MIPAIIAILFGVFIILLPAGADSQWAVPLGFGSSYVSDTIPEQVLPGHSYPVLITFRNTGLVTWQDEMRRIGLLYEGDYTKITAIPSFVEVPKDLNVTPGKVATFGFTLLPVGIPGAYDLTFSVVMRSAVGDQKITETYVKKVKIVPTDGISSPVNGSIYVESSVHNLKVLLDSSFQGNVPAIIADVKPGQYEIRVMNNSFEKNYPVDVERGSMTRLFIQGENVPPVITKKKVGPISDGTVIGYIEANIPLTLIIFLIVVICGGIGVFAIRKRKRSEEKWSEDEKEEDEEEDIERGRLRREKLLLDKIHSKKPVIEGFASSGGVKSSGRKKSALIKDPDTSKKVGNSSHPSGKSTPAKQDVPPSIPDVDVEVRNLETKPGSAVASIGVSNRSPSPITIEDQHIGVGGFGILPVELDEPLDDEPEIVLSLRILTESTEFFKKISIHYNRGIALLARGVVEKAYEYFRSLLYSHPDNIEALLNQAEILMGWGLEEEAVAVLKEILALDPTNEEAQNALEEIQATAARRKENREPDPRPKIEDYPEELSDRYTPVRVLGDDPFATVVLVRKNDTGDLRALKIPREMGNIGSSLYTEISLLYQLHHPYVLRMFRAEFSPVVMLELEYVAGGYYEGEQRMSLADLPVPLPEDVWLPLIEKIAEGLAYLHRQGVRHYHLSPKHIFLDEPMVPKISGLIRESLRDAGGSDKEEFFVRAPEQAEPQLYGNPGKRTDIFQLGAIWLWLANGQMPDEKGYDLDDEESTARMSWLNGDCGRYVPLVRKLTARFKKDRYSSVELFLDELREASQNNLKSHEYSPSKEES